MNGLVGKFLFDDLKAQTASSMKKAEGLNSLSTRVIVFEGETKNARRN
jgi:hypothetical protein